MKHTFPFLFLLVVTACSEPETSISQTQTAVTAPVDSLSVVEEHYRKFTTDSVKSTSKGTVSNGSLEHGQIFPFSGNNYHYFDTSSYLASRCFVHSNVKACVLETYKKLEKTAPGRLFGIMECSNEHGGKIAPHRTHQNGLSVDFMTPLIKDGKPYTDLDFVGAQHYLMNFDANGRYEDDPAVSIDFELMAQHLLTLIETAKNNGLSIEKIIWKTELRDELFATESGKKLQQSGVYITTNLTPLINALHDDHYHVDFKLK
ncbi:MAG TPA: penicillin-insensitive murein endopeptidase [Fluviicola sp.]|nr:penicillin-insensitive murein endopeptidase [Fluviicola sp.]